MAKTRADKTLADYLAIAVCPLLIMALVGSLTFFLQGMLYRGQFDSRVKWILFWFVVGMVLIGRIAIESGRSHAGLFTLGLGAVVSMAVFRFVPEKPLAVIGCLALIWWLTDKLTWDCTLIDENEDASGEGLLRVAGVGDKEDLTASTKDAADRKEKQSPLWMRLLLNSGERAGQPHVPGLWVVYFSLAALPVFGFGQNLIPTSMTSERGFAFQCLFVYVGSALGLLLLTSFLGLRRYLRQRGMQMPPKMALTWVSVGSLLGLGVLALCILLPRPQGELTLTAMIDRASDKIEEASHIAPLKMDGVRDPQRQGAAPNPEPQKQEQAQGQQAQGQQAQGQQAQGQQAQGQQAQGQQAQGQQAQGQQAQGQQAQGQQAQGQQAQGQQQSGERRESSTPQPQFSSMPEMLSHAFRWGMYGILVIAALWGLIKFWRQISEFFTNLWHEFLSMFQRSARDLATAKEDSVSVAEVARAFADFSNPFASGRAKKVAPTELVRYTFEALEAWAAEHQCGRSLDQTPLEFGQVLLANNVRVANDGNELAQLYARVAYAGQTPNADCLPLLERLWRDMKARG